MIGLLGAPQSQLSNIELAFGATVIPKSIYTGIFMVVPSKTDDTVAANTAVAIPNPFIETALLDENESDENVCHFAGIRLRVVGFGNLLPTFYGIDKVMSNPMISIVMSQLNAIEPIRLGNFTSQRALVRLEVQALGEIFTIDRIVIFAKTIGTSLPG
jgi:hypothetical protein